MSSEIIIDDTGQADVSFKGIPLRTIKKALFNTKLNTVHTLLKMVVNGATYNFEETSQNGAVVFNKEYSGWVFVAPDGRLDFASYANSTLGGILDDMEAVLDEKPIPAWDAFTEWLSSYMGESGFTPDGLSKVTFETVSATTNYETTVDLPNFTATNCVEFIENLEVAFAAALDIPGADIQGTAGGVAFVVNMYTADSSGTETKTLVMAFTFRE